MAEQLLHGSDVHAVADEAYPPEAGKGGEGVAEAVTALLVFAG